MTNSNKTLRVCVAGLGTVGTSVVRRLVNNQTKLQQRCGRELQLVGVAELADTPGIDRELPSGCRRMKDASDLIREVEADAFVELIGGLSPARELTELALDQGLHVVTANKELLAKHGDELFDRAKEAGKQIRFEASVGGSIPIVRTIREAFVNADVEAAYGIINGTANYVLTRMEQEELTFEEALTEAQNQGYAESDPSYDVEGDDTAHKVAILTSLAFGTRLDLEQVPCKGITRITPEILADARRLGYRIKLLGIAKRDGSQVDVRVHPTMIPEESALAAVNHEYNAVYVKADPLGSSMLYGKGAGGDPTATAVVSDLVSLSVPEQGHWPESIYWADEDAELVPPDEVTSRYYLRLLAEDEPGVLSEVTHILGEHGISIDSVIQHGRSRSDRVPVILTTHRAQEAAIQDALAELKELPDVGDQPVLLRIEEELDQ